MAARNALFAPAHVIGARVPPGSNGGPPDQAPSLFWGGNGIQDSRVPYNTANSATGAGALGWHGQGLIKVIGAVPSAISTTNIAAAQAVASGTAMTLTAGTGITALTAAMLALGSMNTIPVGALAIDGAPAYVRFGSLPNSFKTVFYDPAGMIARAVSVTAAASAAGGAVTIAGFDVYGFPLTQTVTAVAATTVTTLKAFKFVTSVTPAFTDASHNYSVGTSDVYGLPLVAKQIADVQATFNSILLGSTTMTFAAAVTTSPATAATGDVRGTITLPGGTPSDGTKRLDVFVFATISDMEAMPASLFGVAQV